MTLREFPFRISYGAADDRLNDFYIPALSRSVSFDRTAGFFSSASLALAASGLASLIRNGGRMRLLCGAQLSFDDVEAVRKGDELRGVVERAMVGCLADPTDDTIRARLEALAWMVATETLEMRVVLPRGRDGLPLAGSEAIEYFHPKEGLFEDSEGNRLAFSGSANESLASWQWNYEVFCVYATFGLGEGPDAAPPLPGYVARVEHRFRDLWTGRERDWIALPIPEAVRLKLLSWAPSMAPERDPLERRPPPPAPPLPPIETTPEESARDEALLAFIREAPFLPGAERIGIETAGIEPWPHQERVVLESCRRYPESLLFADEVGLGKTIEAGLVLRTLLISRRAARVLILAPSSVLAQWQEELWEKFALDLPRFDGAAVVNAHGERLPTDGRSIWNAFDLLLASSQLAKRRERQAEVLAAQPWDLVIVDEAHHARRKDFLDMRARPNRLLELLGGSGGRPGLMSRTKCLYLLTATPMQVHPVEVWDLLRLLRVGGRWGTDQAAFLSYYHELTKPFESVNWDLVLDMLQDHLGADRALDPDFEATAKKRLGAAEWQTVKALPFEKKRGPFLLRLSKAARVVLRELAERHTPLKKVMWRNTRPLLRAYREAGLIAENVPERKPLNRWVPLSSSEQELYHRIEDYISDFYAKYEHERKGLGFVMTVYRRRLTSSFSAFQKSLERRRESLTTGKGQLGLTEDDLEQADLDLDVSEAMDFTPAERKLFRKELSFIDDFLVDLRGLGSDSKLDRLFAELSDVFKTRDTVIVFTQFTDTMDYLRDRLREIYGKTVACYSGRGGEVWDGVAWAPRPKEELKGVFREGKEIKLLLCTESASEGLNLQTCGVLVNYDMPWNPMRVEQRIGRIDRIGQRFSEVWVRNYFIADTVEALVYQRLESRIGSFELVVGELQPILNSVARVIEKVSLGPRAGREDRLASGLKNIDVAIAETKASGVRLEGSPSEPVPLRPPAAGSPVSLADLESTLTRSLRLGALFDPHPTFERSYQLRWRGHSHQVTFDRSAFDKYPESVALLTYGTKLLDELLSESGSGPRAGERDGFVLVRREGPAPKALFVSRRGDPLRRPADIDAALAEDAAATTEAVERKALDMFEREFGKEESSAPAAAPARALARERDLKVQAARILRDAWLLEVVDRTPTTDAATFLRGRGVPFKGLLSLLGRETPPWLTTEDERATVRLLSAPARSQRKGRLQQEGIDLLTGWKELTQPSAAATTASSSLQWLGKAVTLPTAPRIRTFRWALVGEFEPFVNAVPALELEAAAGVFGGTAAGPSELSRLRSDELRWVPIERKGSLRSLFVARVVGRSMNRRIPDGAYCLFEARPAGSRNGQVVLVELHDGNDPETGSRFTIKVYRSEKKKSADDAWRHTRITLEPDSTEDVFRPIVLESDTPATLTVIGRLVQVLGLPVE